MHASATRKLLYGCVYVRDIIHSIELMDYLYIRTNNTITKIVVVFFVIVWLCVCTGDNSLNRANGLSVHTHKQYNNKNCYCFFRYCMVVCMYGR